jgi:hypothetical protein
MDRMTTDDSRCERFAFLFPLSSSDKVAQRFIDRDIERRLFIAAQNLFPFAMRPLRCVETSAVNPISIRLARADERIIESICVSGKCVFCVEVMPARSDSIDKR